MKASLNGDFHKSWLFIRDKNSTQITRKNNNSDHTYCRCQADNDRYQLKRLNNRINLLC